MHFNEVGLQILPILKLYIYWFKFRYSLKDKKCLRKTQAIKIEITMKPLLTG
jgi:hypothetical protein